MPIWRNDLENSSVQPQNWQHDLYFQGKPLNITVIQVYAPTTDAEESSSASSALEDEADQFYEDLQHLLELTPKTYVLFIIGDWNAEVLRWSRTHGQSSLALEWKRKHDKG